MNVFDYVVKSVHPNRPEMAFVDAEDASRRLSWTESVSLVTRLAGGLQACGIKPGDTVAHLSRNDIYYGIVMMAVSITGAAFLGLPPQSLDLELVRYFKLCNPALIFVEPDLWDRAGSAAAKSNFSPSKLAYFDARRPMDGSPAFFTFMSLLRNSSCSATDLEVDRRGETFNLVLTSGTTGLPKGAKLSHKAHMIASSGLRPAEVRRSLHSTPLYHSTGAVVIISSFLGNHTLYVSRNVDPCSIIDNVEKFGITNMISYPRLLEEINLTVGGGKRDRHALKSLRFALIGGSMLTRRTFASFKALLQPDAVVVNAYGGTETGLVCMPNLNGPIDADHVGVPLPNVELRVINPVSLEDVPNDSEGEIIMRSPCYFTGYLNDEDATNNAFLPDRNGGSSWLRTGDKGYYSTQMGQYRLTGRFKEVFKVADAKEVSPEEVREALLSIDLVEDAAVTSRPGRRANGGLEPIAYVVYRGRLTGLAIALHAAQLLSPYKAPTGGVVFVDEIKRTAYGKILRQDLPSADAVEYLALEQ